MAGLRSLAVVGGSMIVGLATHPKKRLPVEKEIPLIEPTTSASRKPVSSRKKALEPKRIAFHAGAHSARNHAAEFGIKCMRADADGETSLAQLHRRYRTYCDENSLQRLSPPDLARELGALFSRAGLAVEDREGDLVVRGVSLA